MNFQTVELEFVCSSFPFIFHNENKINNQQRTYYKKQNKLEKKGEGKTYNSLQSSLLVHDLDVQLLGSLDDSLSLESRDVVSDDSSDGGVVHQQELELSDVVDDEGVEAGAQHGSGGLVGAIADSGHQERVFVATADLVIDTAGLSPRGLYIQHTPQHTNNEEIIRRNPQFHI